MALCRMAIHKVGLKERFPSLENSEFEFGSDCVIASFITLSIVDRVFLRDLKLKIFYLW